MISKFGEFEVITESTEETPIVDKDLLAESFKDLISKKYGDDVLSLQVESTDDKCIMVLLKPRTTLIKESMKFKLNFDDMLDTEETPVLMQLGEATDTETFKVSRNINNLEIISK